MSDQPHVVLRHQGQFGGWCVHFTGLHKDKCEAGVLLADVRTEGTYTVSTPDKPWKKVERTVAHPCFKDLNPVARKCEHCRFPTAEEIEKEANEHLALIGDMNSARQAVVDELLRRHKAGDRNVLACNNGVKAWVSGSGTMPCPVCKKGQLQYSRASCNGHVHCRCSTDKCVNWME